MTSASTIAGAQAPQANIVAIDAPVETAEVTINASAQISVATDRAVRASRSDERSLSDVVAIEEASAASEPAPVVDDATRVGLASVATSAQELGELQDQAQSQAKEAADTIKAKQKRADDIAAQAAADAAAAAELAAREAQRGVRVTPIQVNYNLSARFGQRGGLWSRGWHTGLDFRVKNGTPVVAAAGGEIIKAERDGAYGNRIEIDHGDGTVTAYNHLSEILVSSGWVDAGELIAKSGSTGNVTGPHLHFEVYENGDFINPAVWLWK
jgi:murein DD-endopeptidase MepM/ murein hydrolase activator NlpD